MGYDICHIVKICSCICLYLRHNADSWASSIGQRPQPLQRIPSLNVICLVMLMSGVRTTSGIGISDGPSLLRRLSSSACRLPRPILAPTPSSNPPKPFACSRVTQAYIIYKLFTRHLSYFVCQHAHASPKAKSTS